MSRSRTKPILKDQSVQLEAMRRYQKGESLSALSEFYGCSYEYLSKLFKKHGVSVRSASEQHQADAFQFDDQTAGEVCDRYQSGESIKSIEADMKIHHNHISNLLKSKGIKIRTGPTTHQMADTPEYGVWKNLTRKRGPSTCQGWSAFAVWFSDVGIRPNQSLKFARGDKSRGFACGNCSECQQNKWKRNGDWMSPKKACSGSDRNTWIEFNGKRQILADWELDTGIHRLTIVRRLNSGWSVEKTLTTPPDAAANQPDKKGLDHEQTIDLEGERFGDLLVLDFAGHRKRNIIQWLCRCSCGRRIIVDGRSLRDGHTKSCGCLNVRMDKQGRIPDGSHPLYVVWNGMLRRCKKDADYAGRGIVVCKRWKESFWDFVADMGERPSKHTIERIDNDGNYSCGKCEDCVANNWSSNCVWADHRTQARNKRNTRLLEAFGMIKSLSEWAEITGLDRRRIDTRIRRGWDIERALTTPSDKTPNPRKP